MTRKCWPEDSPSYRRGAFGRKEKTKDRRTDSRGISTCYSTGFFFGFFGGNGGGSGGCYLCQLIIKCCKNFHESLYFLFL